MYYTEDLAQNEGYISRPDLDRYIKKVVQLKLPLFFTFFFCF